MPPDESICCFNDIEIEMEGWREALESAKEVCRQEFVPAFCGSDHPSAGEWVRYIDVIVNEIPWHWLKERHMRFRIEIATPLLESKQANFTRQAPLLYVFRKHSNWRGSAQYWGQIFDNGCEISLPAGEYFFSISSKWKNTEYTPDMFARVTFSDSGQIIFEGSEGLSASKVSGGTEVVSRRFASRIFFVKLRKFARSYLGTAYIKAATFYRSFFPRGY